MRDLGAALEEQLYDLLVVVGDLDFSLGDLCGVVQRSGTVFVSAVDVRRCGVGAAMLFHPVQKMTHDVGASAAARQMQRRLPVLTTDNYYLIINLWKGITWLPDRPIEVFFRVTGYLTVIYVVATPL